MPQNQGGDFCPIQGTWRLPVGSASSDITPVGRNEIPMECTMRTYHSIMDGCTHKKHADAHGAGACHAGTHTRYSTHMHRTCKGPTHGAKGLGGACTIDECMQGARTMHIQDAQSIGHTQDVHSSKAVTHSRSPLTNLPPSTIACLRIQQQCMTRSQQKIRPGAEVVMDFGRGGYKPAL